MSLSIWNTNRSKPYVHIKEDLYYWEGQMKHYIWMETHNEDVDSHYCDWDIEPHD